MVHAHDRPHQPHNRLLAALPADGYAALAPHLEPVTLASKEPVYAPNQPIPHVLFPTTGVFSVLTVMADGAAIEVATVGNEGMVGLPLFLGTTTTPNLIVAQISGESLRLPAAAFQEAVEHNRDLVAILHRYTQALLLQIAQSAACNRLHTMEQRCARWLLLTHDRVAADQFPITHEFLAQMLGVRRASVTEAVGTLQQAGLIAYRRGKMTVVDRAGLEAAACECYGVIRAEYDRLLG